jgi:hypothetical protein
VLCYGNIFHFLAVNIENVLFTTLTSAGKDDKAVGGSISFQHFYAFLLVCRNCANFKQLESKNFSAMKKHNV